MTPARLVTVGECLCVFVPSDDRTVETADGFRMFAAGAEANVAVGASRLGISTAFIGRVGDDAAGRRVVRTLRADGVDTTGVTVDGERPTGLIVRNAVGVRPVDVMYQRRNSAGSALEPDDLDRLALASTDVVHVSGITPMLSVSSALAVAHLVERATTAQVPISFDVNVRYRLGAAAAWRDCVRPILPSIDVLLVSADELHVVSDRPDDVDASIEAIHERGPEWVIVKTGAEGAVVSRRGAGSASAPAHPVRIVDPVGAGDAFAAAALARLMTDGFADASPIDVALDGVAAAAVALGHLGDMDPLPDRRMLAAQRAGSKEIER